MKKSILTLSLTLAFIFGAIAPVMARPVHGWIIQTVLLDEETPYDEPADEPEEAEFLISETEEGPSGTDQQEEQPGDFDSIPGVLYGCGTCDLKLGVIRCTKRVDGVTYVYYRSCGRR